MNIWLIKLLTIRFISCEVCPFHPNRLNLRKHVYVKLNQQFIFVMNYLTDIERRSLNEQFHNSGHNSIILMIKNFKNI